MLLIGICGASGSGKTTLAEALIRRAGVPGAVISQDAYYIDHPELSFAERSRLNYDAPDAFDHALLYQDVCALLSGRPIPRRGYDFSRHRRADTGDIITPGDVLIVEGIHAFYDPRLRDQTFLKVYMNVDMDLCLLRRIQRDLKERGRDIDGIADQYRAFVKPMYEKYIRHYIDAADLAVTRGGKNAPAVTMLAACLKSELTESLENDP